MVSREMPVRSASSPMRILRATLRLLQTLDHLGQLRDAGPPIIEPLLGLFDHVGRRALREVGILELLVHLLELRPRLLEVLLQPRQLDRNVDEAGERHEYLGLADQRSGRKLRDLALTAHRHLARLGEIYDELLVSA